MKMPELRPMRPFFSSGPCAKNPQWNLSQLDQALLGRSHRSKIAKARLQSAIERTRDLLHVPKDYKIAIVPASDTGAFEMSLWSMLGARKIEAMAFESFGAVWLNDIKDQLKLENVRLRTSDYGTIPDLQDTDMDADIVFTWNGTTGGTRVPDGNWIADDRKGLTLCDATSAVFAYDLPWHKLDVTTWSWQKILGGEAAHGMLVLSPRAVERLENYSPPWPLPKLFRMTKNGKLNDGLFSGETINTPSMLCVEDLHVAYDWVNKVGGLKGMIARSEANLAVIRNFVDAHDWLEFMAKDASIRSTTALCLMLSSACPLEKEMRDTAPKRMAELLEAEGVAFDINGYRDAPPSLRIWGGGTVETKDIEALMPWVEWAYHEIVYS